MIPDDMDRCKSLEGEKMFMQNFSRLKIQAGILRDKIMGDKLI